MPKIVKKTRSSSWNNEQNIRDAHTHIILQESEWRMGKGQYNAERVGMVLAIYFCWISDLVC